MLYIGLTRNVYRWTPVRENARLNAHTIDERVDMNIHLEIVRFYYDLIRNFDIHSA
jgi:Gly-Xaa carboxypeptidase